MQTSMEAPHVSVPQILLGLASFLVGGTFVRLLTLYINRQLPAANVSETAARARKVNADADVELNAIIDRLHLRLDQMQMRIDELRDERNSLRDLTDQQRIELQSYDDQQRRMRAFLTINGLHYPDAGTLKRVLMIESDETL